MAQLSAVLCDQVHLAFLEEAGHWLPPEKAQAVNQLLIDFCRKMRQAGSSKGGFARLQRKSGV